MIDALMLVCATVGSMAFGVLAAYAVFRMAFALMRPRRRAIPVKTQTEPAL